MITLLNSEWMSILRSQDFSSHATARRRSGVILGVLVGLIGFSYFLVAGLLSGAEMHVSLARVIALLFLGGFCVYLVRWRNTNPSALYIFSSLVSFSTIFMVLVVVYHRPASLSLTWLELSAPLFLALCVHYFALRLEPLLALSIGGGLSVLMMFQIGLIASPDSSATHALFYVAAMNAFGFLWLCINKSQDRVIFEDMQRLRQSDLLQRKLLLATEHELRQPLVALRTLVSPALVASSPREEAGRLSGIADAVRLLDNTFEYIHVWGRTIGGQASIRISDVRVADVLADAAYLARIEAGVRGVELEFDSCEPDLIISSNAAAVRQILVNLVINAIRHSPNSSGGPARVRVAVRSRRGQCTILVADNGVGIPVALRKEMWLPFKTGAGSDLHPDRRDSIGDYGSGLGLYLVDTTVSGLAGHAISFRSFLNRGTVFRLRLPLVVKDDRDGFRAADESSGGSYSEEPGSRSKVVVLFETNREAAVRAQDILRSEAFSVEMYDHDAVPGDYWLHPEGSVSSIVCVDQESVAKIWSRRAAQSSDSAGLPVIVYMGARTADIPSAGLVVLPDSEQGYALLPRLLEHARSPSHP